MVFVPKEKAKGENIHDGHRKRLRSRYLNFGLETFEDHNVLELILSFAIPRADVNPVAHALIKRFGSFSSVLDARPEELMSVEGIGENTAALITLFRQVNRRYLISLNANNTVVRDMCEAGQILAPHFAGELDEVVYALSIAPNGKVLRCQLLFRGSVNSAQISVSKIIEAAIARGTAGIILAHNHPNGFAIPS